MYRVLLVDDEPLILSGIKFMIEWESCGCELIGTARNGQQALEIIEQKQPDIVIADINMPVMNGIELLKQAGKLWPHIVFIMLTNLQEFALAQEALRLHAVDYITKSQLEAPILHKSLAAAIAEVTKRANLARVNLVDSYMQESESKIVKHAALQYITQSNVSKEYTNLLLKNQMLGQYQIIRLHLSFPSAQSSDEKAQLLKWEYELIQTMLNNSFPSSLLLQDQQNDDFYIFHYHVSQKENTQKVSDFCSRLATSSATITNLSIYAQVTSVLSGLNSRSTAQQQISQMEDYLYLFSTPVIIYDTITVPELQPLAVSASVARLQAELNVHNSEGCKNVLEKILTQIETIPHQRSQATWLCSELYKLSSSFVAEKYPDEENWLHNKQNPAQNFDSFFLRTEVLYWITTLLQQLPPLVKPLSTSSADVVEKARQFAIQNIDKRLSLQEVADYVAMSPSYFSAFFKRETGQNYIDYVNQIKIEHARRLIDTGEYRMNEISSLLGFENAYYFSKVFRRYTGLSPTEYRHKITQDDSADK